MTHKNKIKLVSDWREGWRWFSTWALLALVYLTLNPLPPEVLVFIPEPHRDKMVAVIAIAGFVLRFVKQSKGVRHD